MPLSGTALIESGPQRVDSTPDVASVVSPDDDLAMHWADDNDPFMLRVGRSLLERTLVGHLGCTLELSLIHISPSTRARVVRRATSR